MMLGILGLVTGMVCMYIWQTYGESSKTGADMVKVLCYKCGVSYSVSYKNIRTSNYCPSCK